MSNTPGKVPHDESMTTLRLTCFCGGVKASFSVPDSVLPLPFDLCHCETCRHQSGQLAIQACEIPPQHRSSFSVEGPIVKYDGTGKLLRCFCHTCGANVYFEDIDTKDIFFDTGGLEWEGRSDLLKAAQHIFVSDTTDGGMSVWLPDLPAYRGHPDEGPKVPLKEIISAAKAPVTSTPSSTVKEEYLPCYCRCKAVQFNISRPNEQSRKTVAGPHADLLKPSVSTPDHVKQNKDNEQWHLRQPNSTRYTAGLCACNSCRKSSGFDIQAWAYIPLVNLHEAGDDSARPLDIAALKKKKSAGGGLKTHHSSPGRYRDFCGRCGATVFWHCDERPGLIDVSIGLMAAREGARAETWLDILTGRVSFEEEAVNEQFVGSLKEGMKAWGDGSRP